MNEIAYLVLAGAALVGWQQAYHWRRSYAQALELFRSLPRAPEKTPHQRGAETRKRRELERLKAHREAMQRSIDEASRV